MPLPLYRPAIFDSLSATAHKRSITPQDISSPVAMGAKDEAALRPENASGTTLQDLPVLMGSGGPRGLHDGTEKDHGGDMSIAASNDGFFYDEEAEKRLRRKIDLHIVPVVFFMYMFCFIDRINLGNARIAGLEKDLGMNPKSYDYNFLVMAFYLPYAIAEFPSMMLCKKFGPGWWLPLCTSIFGVTTLCFAFVRSFEGACVNRVFLALAEACMLPGFAYYLSRWYRKTELALRIAFFMCSAPIAGAIGSLLASAILTKKNIGSLKRWEMIFFVEGMITLLIGLSSFVLLTDRIDTARWLTPQEKQLANARLTQERVSSDAVLDRMRFKQIFKGVFNATTLVVMFHWCVISITVQSFGYMLPTIIKIDFPTKTTVQQQLLSAPPYFLGVIISLIIAYYACRIQRRIVFLVPLDIFVIIGYGMLAGTHHLDHTTRFAAIFLIAGAGFGTGPLLADWVVSNTNTDSARAGALSTINFLGNLGGIASCWTYLPKDAPDYTPPNLGNTLMNVIVMLMIIVLSLYLRRENQKKERGEHDERIIGLDKVQQEELGHQHPDFRYQY